MPASEIEVSRSVAAEWMILGESEGKDLNFRSRRIMCSREKFSRNALDLCCESEVQKIVDYLKAEVLLRFNKRGLVLGLSGGVDSSVVAALCARAVGPERVLGLQMPDRESSEETRSCSQLIVEFLGIETSELPITDILESLGCYQLRDEAIHRLIPEYDSRFKCKVILPSIFDRNSYRFFLVVVESPSGEVIRKRLSAEAFLEIFAASSFKQRVRKMLEYYHADRLNYAVSGTPNRLEYDQGFFVKTGDGAADVKPIAHLYKTQVYQLAEHLGLPKEIRSRTPTTDTYSMVQSQEEFYFSLPYGTLDLCLYGKNHGVSADEVAGVTGLTTEEVHLVYREIDAKREATAYLHAAGMIIGEVPEVPFVRA